MEILFIAICTIMTGLMIWWLGWWYLAASGIATFFMMAIFKVAGPG